MRKSLKAIAIAATTAIAIMLLRKQRIIAEDSSRSHHILQKGQDEGA